MIDLKINKSRLKNHLHYSKWLYVVALIGVLIVFNLAYTMSEPQVPTEFKVSVLVNNFISDDEGADKLEQEILAALPEDQQEVTVFSLAAGGQDMQIMQVLMARMVAKQDDVLILPYETFVGYAQQSAYLPLEGRVTIPTQPEGVDMDKYKVELVDDEGNGNGDPQLYGIPLDGSVGLQSYGLMTQGMVICVPVTSENQDNGVRALQYMLDKTTLDEGMQP